MPQAGRDRQDRGRGRFCEPLGHGPLLPELQIAHQMWSGEVTLYYGTYYHLEEMLESPQALSQPHPPIMIGGMGEKKTLRLVAQYADW